MVKTCGLSVRVACKAMDLRPSTYYYESIRNERSMQLVGRIHELAREYPMYGYEQIWGKLRQEHWRVGCETVRRIWRREGLQVGKKRVKHRRIGTSTRQRQRALYPNHVWSWDFIFDRLEDGRSIKILSIVDEYSRFNIRLEPKRRFTGRDVVLALGNAMLEYGIPASIRSDNGSEFIGSYVRDWVENNGIGMLYIEPGSPWQNAYVESFHARLRWECLSRELFEHILEAQVVIEDWSKEYNWERPHGGIKHLTPAEVYQKYIPLQSDMRLRDDIEFTGREYLN